MFKTTDMGESNTNIGSNLPQVRQHSFPAPIGKLLGLILIQARTVNCRAPIRREVNIGIEPFLGILQKGRALNDYEYLGRSREAMFDHLVWWGEALKAARQRTKAA